MGRAFGTNITNTVGTVARVASKDISKVVQHRSLSTSSLPTNVKNEFKNESSIMNHQHVTSSVLKPKPVFACAPIGSCLNQFSSHDRTSGPTSGLTSISNSQPIKSSQCLTPTLGRSLSDSGFGSIPRLKLKQMPNILKRKRKSSSGSVFNSTPTEVSISTTPIISNRNDFWPLLTYHLTPVGDPVPLKWPFWPWNDQNVVKWGCLLLSITFELLFYGFYYLWNFSNFKLVRISIVMGTLFSVYSKWHIKLFSSVKSGFFLQFSNFS